jgi:hypothetical protein
MREKLFGSKNSFFGKKHTKQTLERMREAKRGQNNPNYGKTPSDVTREKLRLSKQGKNHPLFGKKASDETREKQRNSHMGLFAKEKHPNWQGGKSFEPYCVKFNNEFKQRVRAFFGGVCVECGETDFPRKLSVHHVNFKKDACCNKEVLPIFVTLCLKCHIATNKNRDYWEHHFTEIIETKYHGKCYLSKEEMEALNG